MVTGISSSCDPPPLFSMTRPSAQRQAGPASSDMTTHFHLHASIYTNAFWKLRQEHFRRSHVPPLLPRQSVEARAYFLKHSNSSQSAGEQTLPNIEYPYDN